MEVVLVHCKLKVDRLGVSIIAQQIAEDTADVHRTIFANIVPRYVRSKPSKHRRRVNASHGCSLRSVFDIRRWFAVSIYGYNK
jgi:hypothetical protein